ncbi:MAG: cytochrome c-type biogenesis protein CcmH [Candidatus Limnocylindrales bacterium]
MRRPRAVPSAWVLGAVGGLALAIAVAVATTGSPSATDRARALDLQLRCPVCQGVSIADSPSESAAQMRAVVRERLAAGASDDEIEAYFVARFGTWVLLAPPGDGLGALLWVVPGASMLAGAIVLVWRARRRPIAGAGAGTEPTHGVASAALPGVPPASSRWPAAAGLGLVLVAVALPLAVAIVPRVAGQEISGRPASQTLLDLAELESRVMARPDDTTVALDLGAAYLDAGRPADAAALYGAVLRRTPDVVEAVLGLGVAALDGGRPDAAIAFFDRALTLDPGIADAYLYRAIARFAAEGGASERTRADAGRFAAMKPTDPRADAAQRLADGAVP